MKSSTVSKKLTPQQREALLSTLHIRFKNNGPRHADIDWKKVQTALEADAAALWSLSEMERTGGEPDVVGFDKKRKQFIFMDCSPESPAERRSLCYDREALDSRKEHKPKNSAADLAAAMGVSLLTEEQYHQLQSVGEFDLKTSSWLSTPDEIRELGGAIFGDRRFGRVFIYHNGAESYYAARGFRTVLMV
ncbi:MAG: DUF4256 domain-containing protein [Bacteroidetes bacterium]|nr:DUF4256 domain-containing protein [Bacteroidota bacterium]